MPIELSGFAPSQFDRTLARVLRTIETFDVSDDEILLDQEFLHDLVLQVGMKDNAPNDGIDLLDCAFIGLLYHRHMPFLDPHTDETVPPDRAPNEYGWTLRAVGSALIHQVGIPRNLVERTLEEGADISAPYLRVDTASDITLHIQVIMLCCIGMLIHRLLPGTSTPPRKGH
jgi:hypothetical protein